jgi:hypothetical protein
MINLISRYWYILVILFLALVIYFQDSRLDICQLKLSNINEQVEKLELESKTFEAKVIKAQNQAETNLKTSQLNVDRIMSSNVPMQCNEAIRWGISQSKSL